MVEYLRLLEEFVPSCEQEERDLELILSCIHADPYKVLTRESFAAHFAPSGLILNTNMDHVLFVHHNIYNTWCWTGGHADGDPDFAHVALKEAQEETGLPVQLLSSNIISLDVLYVPGHIKHGKYVSTHLHLCPSFLLVADETIPPHPKGGENTAVSWFDITQIHQVSGEPELFPVYDKLVARAQAFQKERNL